MSKMKIAVLASGRGSNLQAIMDNIQSNTLNVEIAVVICDNHQAYALERARSANIDAVSFVPSDFPNKLAFEQAIIEKLQNYQVELVVLAGYMRIISADFVRAFPNKILNIHPALLPAFPGLHAQKQAVDYGAKLSGCTVHFVDEGMDTGPIISQIAVPVEHDDTPDSLADRIIKCEHRLYSEVIECYAQGRIQVNGRRVTILPKL